MIFNCRYKQNSDGTRQLQTIRYESIEITQEMIDQESEPGSMMKNFKEDTSIEESVELCIDIESEEEGLPEKVVFEASSTKTNV